MSRRPRKRSASFFVPPTPPYLAILPRAYWLSQILVNVASFSGVRQSYDVAIVFRVSMLHQRPIQRAMDWEEDWALAEEELLGPGRRWWYNELWWLLKPIVQEFLALPDTVRGNVLSFLSSPEVATVKSLLRHADNARFHRPTCGF